MNPEKSENKPEDKKSWYDAFVDYVVDKWKSKGIVKTFGCSGYSVTDEEKTRENIDAMMFLISNYRLKCLIITLFELDDLMEEFDEKHPEYNEETEEKTEIPEILVN